jgi:hypothetical protein
MVIVILIALTGALARAAYIAVVHPKSEWVAPMRTGMFSLALGLGLAAAAVEVLVSYSGLRKRLCANLLAA